MRQNDNVKNQIKDIIIIDTFFSLKLKSPFYQHCHIDLYFNREKLKSDYLSFFYIMFLCKLAHQLHFCGGKGRELGM